MDQAKEFEPRHFGYIDTLRGLAFLGVLCTHTAGCVGKFPLSGLAASGRYGVQLFFLASAITLCSSSARRVQLDRHAWLSFFLRRLFRIAPLFWLAMVFYWVCPHTWPEYLHQTDPDAGIQPYYFVLTTFFVHGWRPETLNAIVPGGWSIAVEMTFYMLFPLCFFYINSLKKALVAVVASMIFAQLEMIALNKHLLGFGGANSHDYFFFIEHWFPSQAPTFLIGLALYYFLKSEAGSGLTRSVFWSRALFLFCLAIYPVLLPPKPLSGLFNFVPHHIVMVFPVAGLVVVAASNTIPYLVNPVFCYIGKISFSCYLVHFAMLVVALRLLGFDVHTTMHDTGSSLQNLINFLKIAATTLVLTVPAATFTFHWVEQPGIEAGRRLIRWLNGRSLPAVVPAPVGAPPLA